MAQRLRTVDWRHDEIVIIDQAALPDATRTMHLRTVDDLVDAIKRLAVRGAMALGAAGALGVALAAQRAEASGDDVRLAAEAAGRQLKSARPTAANLAWGVERALAAAAGGAGAVLEVALLVLEEDVISNRRIGERGADLLIGRRRLLTHCNAGALAAVEWGSALAIVRVLHERGGVDEVFVSETRPLLQGARLTTWELRNWSIPHRLIVDGGARASS